MQKAVASLVAGEWKASRGAGDKLSDVEIAMAQIFADGTNKKFPKGMKTAERYALSLAELETRPDDTQAKVRKLAEKQVADEAERQAKLREAIGDIAF
jgi:hypothetical protein